MLAGIVLVGGIAESNSSQTNPLRGTVFGVLAGIAYGIYLYLTRRHAKREPGRTLAPLAWATTSAAVTAAALAPLSTGLHLNSIPLASWCAIIALAVLGQGLAWILINSGSPHLAPSQTGGLSLVQPVITVALSAILLAEIPTVLQTIGIAITLTAVGLVNRVSVLDYAGQPDGRAGDDEFIRHHRRVRAVSYFAELRKAFRND